MVRGWRLSIKFCYLGDMIGAAGGAEDASRTRVCCSFKKFNELSSVLTLRGAYQKLNGRFIIVVSEVEWFTAVRFGR